MEYNLNGKIVLVTGAANGIGADLIKFLLDEDVKYVAILDVAEEQGIALQNELNTKYKGNKVIFIKCDVSNKERLLEVFKKVQDEVGYIDVIVNNAGILDDSPEFYEKEISINLVAVITISLHAFNIMHKERGGKGGTIINISSEVSVCKSVNVPIYSATKAGVLKFSTSLGDDVHYSKSGIRVLTVCFGITDTTLLKTFCTKKMFDRTAEGPMATDLKKFKSQSSESAAKAIVDAYKRGASGSVWISTSGKPAQDVTEVYEKSIALFDEYVYD